MNLIDPIRHSPGFQAIKGIISHPGAMATTLLAIGYKYLGEGVYNWESETLEMEFEDEFGTPLSAPGANRLHALIAAITSDAFYTDWVAFGSISSALSSEDGDSEMTGPLSTAEIAWGTTEVLLNDSRPAPWSAEVKRFAGTIQAEDGLIKPISILDWGDMPQIYHGSDSGSDRGEQQGVESQHKAVIETFLEEQGVTLFKQLAALPWMTEDSLQQLAKEVRLG